jgi:hypothetical protein
MRGYDRLAVVAINYRSIDNDNTPVWASYLGPGICPEEASGRWPQRVSFPVTRLQGNPVDVIRRPVKVAGSWLPLAKAGCKADPILLILPPWRSQIYGKFYVCFNLLLPSRLLGGGASGTYLMTCFDIFTCFNLFLLLRSQTMRVFQGGDCDLWLRVNVKKATEDNRLEGNFECMVINILVDIEGSIGV